MIGKWKNDRGVGMASLPVVSHGLHPMACLVMKPLFLIMKTIFSSGVVPVRNQNMECNHVHIIIYIQTSNKSGHIKKIRNSE